MEIIAKRLRSWAIYNDLVSKERKSARPFDGCYGNTFLLHKNLFVAWLDLRNAFGSIPHSDNTTNITHIAVPLPLIEMIINSYSGTTDYSSTVHAPTGLAAHIPVLSGVK